MKKHAHFCALVLVLAVAPVGIKASDEGKNRAEPKAAPPAGQAVVDGLRMQAFLERTATGIVVRLRSSESEQAVDRRVKVAVFAVSPMARMSRVRIPPREVGSETIRIQLAVGEALERVISFDNKLNRRVLAFVRILPRVKRARRPNASQPSARQALNRAL